ncbi:hypothetical protein CYQ93_01465 [Acinetobacter baumannii]|nr:hypothetical protein CYQ93_01465 [Acinetobacter baumannii]
MKFYKTILVLGLVVGDYSVSGCDLRTQQEFEKICLSGGHTQLNADRFNSHKKAIYERIWAHYDIDFYIENIFSSIIPIMLEQWELCFHLG